MALKKAISGVVCELDPPHNGHRYLFERAKFSGAALIAVMSGNFVQRGAAAVLDKWNRSRIALSMGADLVVELPVPWAVSTAERFAVGGVALLDALHADTVVFGSECGDAEALQRVADCLLSPAFSETLRPLLQNGSSFAAARQTAVEKLLGASSGALLAEPNNILGVEYCKAIRTLGADLTAETVRRLGAAHDGSKPEAPFASASWIRSQDHTGADLSAFVPEETLRAIQKEKEAGHYPASLQHLDRAILAHLLTVDAEMLRRVPDVSEGLEHRILEAARTAENVTALCDFVKTKRYSHARIRRIVLSAFLGLTNDLPALPPYIRILGMTETGASLLEKAALPILARAVDAKTLGGGAARVLSLESRGDDLYSLCTEPRRQAGLTFTEKLTRFSKPDGPAAQ